MREILYRGKREGNGEWIEGVAFPDDDWSITICRRNPVDSSFDGDKVDPASVGCYTGLKDKNGVKIFEGDIVRCKNYHGTVEGYIGYSKSGVYFLHCISGYSDEYLFNCDNIEIIGNIYDNPDLLNSYTKQKSSPPVMKPNPRTRRL